MEGSIYFIRHGETHANEQNYLAGGIDVPLSDLGKRQAKQAGQIILKKGLKFDEVHTSDLSRTKITALIALKESGQENIPSIESPEVRERDFGIFAKKNKNLLKKSFGYEAYERKLHSPLEFPDSGEAFKDMYNRVHEYYYNVLLPKVESGKSILVVCHKYIIEMFALIFAGLKVDDYFDFRLPNAKPMSEKDLVNYIKSESKLLKEISDRLIYYSSWLIILAAFLGILAKATVCLPLNSFVFLIITCLLLGISTFFIALGLNTSCISNSFNLKKPFLVLWCQKFALAGCLFLLLKDNVASVLAMLFLMPPAFTAPTLSLLWGGSLYLAIENTFLLSLLSPLVISCLLFCTNISFYVLFIPFLTVMFFSMVVPTFIAQLIRTKKPVESAKFAEHWKWLGVSSIILLSFLSIYHFTPTIIFDLGLGDLENSTLFFKQGIIVLLVYLFIKFFAYSASISINKKVSYTTDIYICHSTPNIFLWVNCISFQPDIYYIVFWTFIAFFMGILLDETYFVYRFNRIMISKKTSIADVKPVRVCSITGP
jgi:broad specificity phosphatase PhoE